MASESQSPSTSLALSQPHPDLPNESEWAIIQRMSQMFQASGVYRHLDSVAKVIAVVQTGRELGIPPSAALRSFHFIGGKPTASAEMLAALIYRDHGERALKITESTSTRCTIDYRRRGWDSPGSLTFTMDDAAAAGLLVGEKRNINWDRYPRAMLRSRAISEAARTAFQDSILGMYTSEELAPSRVTMTADGELVLDETSDDDISASDAPRLDAPHLDANPSSSPVPAPRAVDVTTGEIVEGSVAPSAPASVPAPAVDWKARHAELNLQIAHAAVMTNHTAPADAAAQQKLGADFGMDERPADLSALATWKEGLIDRLRNAEGDIPFEPAGGEVFSSPPAAATSDVQDPALADALRTVLEAEGRATAQGGNATAQALIKAREAWHRIACHGATQADVDVFMQLERCMRPPTGAGEVAARWNDAALARQDSLITDRQYRALLGYARARLNVNDPAQVLARWRPPMATRPTVTRGR